MRIPQAPTYKLLFQVEVNTPNPFQTNLSVKNEISKTLASILQNCSNTNFLNYNFRVEVNNPKPFQTNLSIKDDKY